MKHFLARARAAGRIALLVAAGASLAPPARSTWSIIAVDTRTGEICIAAATCLTLDLETYLPVVRVGVGGACAQSLIDLNGHNRLLIWNGMQQGLTAQEILTVLLEDNPQTNKQYGIVTMLGEPATYEGPSVGNARYGVARTIEGLSYAIQGNVLAGIQVVTDAENALLMTEGDLGQRVLAAMEAARIYGGDGRCSCHTAQPTICGSPPPSFLFADETAFFMIARMGDPDGVCAAGFGCANGTYFCNLNEIGTFSGIDPVVRLQSEHAAWRAGLVGRADQLRTVVEPRTADLPSDGTTQLQVDVELRDIEGDAVDDVAATISIERMSGNPPAAKILGIDALAPGHFRITFRAGARVAVGRWRVTAHQGGNDVLLWPEIVLNVE